MASLSGMVTGANTAFHGALDELSALKDNILGGILSIPVVNTALTAAANILIAVNVLKIIKKLPTKISSLQTELLTIAGAAVGTAAYSKALGSLERSELGKAAIKKGHDIANLAGATREIVNTAEDSVAIARGIARNAPNLIFDAATGEIGEIAQESLLVGEDVESEPELSSTTGLSGYLNPKMMSLRDSKLLRSPAGNDFIVKSWSKHYQTSLDPVKERRAFEALEKFYTIPAGANRAIDTAAGIFKGDNNWTENQLIGYLGPLGKIESNYTTKVAGGGRSERSYWQVQPRTATSLVNDSSALFGSKFNNAFSEYATGDNTAVETMKTWSPSKWSKELLENDTLGASMAAAVVVNRIPSPAT